MAHKAHHSKRRLAPVAVLLGLGLLLSACSSGSTSSAASGSSDDAVNIGVIYPKTGQYAEYGRLFEQGFELAVKKVNADGGVQGKELGLKYFDTQSDPKQSAAVAPKLVADPSIIAVVGDYSSGSSTAASPTFQQAGLVHYGFNNSSPTFPETGDHVWSPAIAQDVYQVTNANVVATKAEKIAVVYIENDWGKQAYGFFKDQAEKNGTEIVYESSYLADSTDLSPILIPARDANPDAIVQIGYGPDGALVINTLRDKLGYTGQYFGGQNTPEFLELAGDNAEGSIITGIFTVNSPDPLVQEFVKDFRDEYGEEPGDFNLTAYQAIIDLAYGANHTSATREGIQEALQTITDFPSYQGTGTFKFDQATRRVDNPQPLLLVVHNGAFEVYES